MGNGTSTCKFNGLTTAGGDVLRDVGALSRNAASLSRDPGAPGGNPDTLSSDPDTLSFNPDGLRFDPDALSRDSEALRFDPDALRIDPEILSFDVFHQKRGSNGLISSKLRGIASKPSKFGSFLLSRRNQWKGILPAFLINTVALARCQGRLSNPQLIQQFVPPPKPAVKPALVCGAASPQSKGHGANSSE